MKHTITDLIVQKAVDYPTTLTLKSGKEIQVDAKKRINFTFDGVYHYSFEVYHQKNQWKGNTVSHVRKNGKRKECPYCHQVMDTMKPCPALMEKHEELLEIIGESKFRLRVLFDLQGIHKEQLE